MLGVTESKTTDTDCGRRGKASVVEPDSFESERHFYPRVRNANLHPLVSSFFSMSNKRRVQRYCHLNPQYEVDDVLCRLGYAPSHFRWGGCDTFNTTTPDGNRRTIIVETNSCPSGQKSFPTTSDSDIEDGAGYKKLLENTFAPLLRSPEVFQVKDGQLAVVFDKNLMEASGYASALADLTGESVYLVEFYQSDPDPPVKFDDDGVMHIRVPKAGKEEEEESSGPADWVPIRACFRYVTQQPWDRIPLVTKTLILNPVICCLAGGRNKMLADKAYEMFNGELAADGSNLRILVPETRTDVSKAEVPLWVRSFGGHAVVKVPYSNAGQGVYTILTEADLKGFMDEEHKYDKFIVQSLIGHSKWSSTTSGGSAYFHIGTIPSRKGDIYVTDVRMMVAASEKGFYPVAVYARKAKRPLSGDISDEPGASWEMLGTNLSVKDGVDEFHTESNRLLLMDTKDFNTLGISMDDLIQAFIQTVLAITAIDRMATRLMRPGLQDGSPVSFDWDLFRSLNGDEALISEVKVAATAAADGDGDGDEARAGDPEAEDPEAEDPEAEEAKGE